MRESINTGTHHHVYSLAKKVDLYVEINPKTANVSYINT